MFTVHMHNEGLQRKVRCEDKSLMVMLNKKEKAGMGHTNKAQDLSILGSPLWRETTAASGRSLLQGMWAQIQKLRSGKDGLGSVALCSSTSSVRFSS
eukprot:5519711-Amphidinium_carterae.1